MSESKHTPGPWKIGVSPSKKGARLGFCILGKDPSDGDPLLIVGDFLTSGSYSVVSNPKEAVANAHLIATAPELLEALENLLEAVLAHARTGAVIPPSMMKTIGGAAQALSKAKGGAS